jgi:hypothetical protein
MTKETLPLLTCQIDNECIIYNDQVSETKKVMEENRLDVPTTLIAVLYVLTGVVQPLIMSIAKSAGLADPSCQLYMLFYYLGPALVIFSLITEKESQKLSFSLLWKNIVISIIDIFSQSMNYTGATLAGPTIFAVIYSSVTVWTAIYSRLLLRRQMNMAQWSGIFVVFGGLVITAIDSVQIGEEVFHGALLVFMGSSLHGLVYVLFEYIMTKGETMSVRLTCAMQGIIASLAYGTWQVIYTRRHFDELILLPMRASNTSAFTAWAILCSLALSNLIHALAYFNTLKYFPSGATSAGIGKGLQAALVFVASSLVLCGRIGGKEMCFSKIKFYSLVVVLAGIFSFGRGILLRERNLTKE